MDIDHDPSIDLATLEISDNDRKRSYNEVSSPEPSTSSMDDASELRRSGRKKFRPLSYTDQNKRRVNLRPKKLNVNSSQKDIENYYLDKKIKLNSPCLETIYEEPNNVVMSGRKFKRLINFPDLYDKPDQGKVKKRRLKAKKVNGIKKLKKKVQLDMLLNKLKEVESEEEGQQKVVAAPFLRST